MQLRPSEERIWQPAPSRHFTGRAWFGPLTPPPDPEDALNVLGVMFEPGARTGWHSHPAGQVLYVIAGAGRVQTADGETVTIGPGDALESPPGEVHWHGAAPDSFMVHLSITHGGATQWTGEMVTDEQYHA